MCIDNHLHSFLFLQKIDKNATSKCLLSKAYSLRQKISSEKVGEKLSLIYLNYIVSVFTLSWNSTSRLRQHLWS